MNTPTRRLFFPHGQIFLAGSTNKKMYKIVKKHNRLTIRIGRIGIDFHSWNDHLCDKTATLYPAKRLCLHQ